MYGFIEEYLKERIISEFTDKLIFWGVGEFVFCRGLSNPILTMIYTEDENIVEFALTNVGVLAIEERKNYRSTIDGVISLYNNGRIIISDYDISEYN